MINVWPLNKKLADRSGIPRTSIRHAVDSGQIPHERLADGTRVVKLSDVSKYKRDRAK